MSSSPVKKRHVQSTDWQVTFSKSLLIPQATVFAVWSKPFQYSEAGEHRESAFCEWDAGTGSILRAHVNFNGRTYCIKGHFTETKEPELLRFEFALKGDLQKMAVLVNGEIHFQARRTSTLVSLNFHITPAPGLHGELPREFQDAWRESLQNIYKQMERAVVDANVRDD